METINKTVMEEWTESSVEFSSAIKKLLNEFGFENIYDIKKRIRSYFPRQYLTMCENQGYKLKEKISYDFLDTYEMAWTEHSAIDLAKAILFASTFLETTDMEEIINWAHII